MYKNEIEKLTRIMLDYGERVEGRVHDVYFARDKANIDEIYGTLDIKPEFIDFYLLDKNNKDIVKITVDLYPNNAHELIVDSEDLDSPDNPEVTNRILDRFDLEVLMG